MSKNGSYDTVTQGKDTRNGEKPQEKGKKLVTPQVLEKLDLFYGCFIDPSHLSVSTIKNLLDIVFPDYDSRDNHDFFLSPAGIAPTLLLTGFISTLAIIGRVNLKDKSERTRQWLEFMNTFSKYMREGIQGVKYLYKANRILFKISRHFMDPDVRKFISPAVFLHTTIVLGVISVITRIVLKQIREKRKKHLEYNRFILQQALKGQESDWIEYAKEESDTVRILAMAISIFNGSIDAMYNYFGLLTIISLTSFSPPVFIFLLTLCSIYAAVLMISRISEEYQQQQELILSKLDLEIACKLNELINICDHLLNDQGAEDLKILQAEKDRLLMEFKTLEEKKSAMDSGGYGGAFLKGIKKGLACYAIVGTLAGTSATAAAFNDVQLPVELVLTFLVLGLAILVIYTAYYIVQCYKENTAIQPENDQDKNIEVLESAIQPPALPLTEGFGWEEAWRSACSAFNKAVKTINLAFTPFQKEQDDGQYQDQLWILGISIPYALLVAAPASGLTAHEKNKKSKSYNPSQFFQPKLDKLKMDLDSTTEVCPAA